jgi:CheY-like chemotaxis protein
LVLLADDEPDAREELGETLERGGYEVVTVANGAEALAYLHSGRRPFVIVLDLAMPVMDGWAFLARRNEDPDLRSIPVVVVSGQRNVEDKVAAAHASYVQKPAVAERLIPAMERAAAAS